MLLQWTLTTSNHSKELPIRCDWIGIISRAFAGSVTTGKRTGANQFCLGANRFCLGANRFRLGANRFRLGANRFWLTYTAIC